MRYAFEYARANRRSKVSCFTKDNIMKLTDGLFHQVFDEIGEEYPDIQQDHWIVDIGTARLATRQPETFDVIVTTNLYGDIISDVAAEIAGSVGLAGSANIGRTGFDVRGHPRLGARSSPGQDIANPSGLLLAGVMMMKPPWASPTWPSGCTMPGCARSRTVFHTGDVGVDGRVRRSQVVGTRAFAQAVIDRLGLEPQKLTPVDVTTPTRTLEIAASSPRRAPADRQTVGVDLFVQWRGDADDLAARSSRASRAGRWN